MNGISKVHTLKELIQNGENQFKQEIAFLYRRKKEYKEVTYHKLHDDINGFGTYLYELGIKDKKVAIIGENSYEWLVSFFAVANSRNVVVPIDKELDAVTIYELIQHSNCSIVLYTKSYKNKIRRLVELNNGVIEDYICINHMEEYVETGEQHIQQGKKEFLVEQVKPEDDAAIYFTSGTTGKMKGVLLSHRNLCEDMYGAAQKIQPKKSVFLILPLNHTFALTASVLCVLIGGKEIYICSGIKSFFRDLQEIKPSGLVVVPLFVENIYKTILNKINEEGKQKSYKLLCKINGLFLKFGIDKRKKLFHTIVDSLGGKLDFMVCGGAPLNSVLIEEFSKWDIDIYNGYGITECSPIISVNSKVENRLGSVGKPLENVKVRIDSPDEAGRGEICISGPTVMREYYKDTEQTSQAVRDGWYHTGDIGYLDEEGYLFVTGRIKNLIILANGENITPELLEDKIKTYRLVNEVVVYGKDDKIAAEIYPDKDYAQMHKIQDIEKELNEYITKLNKALPAYQRIKSVIIREEEFEKNTNRKIIRKY